MTSDELYGTEISEKLLDNSAKIFAGIQNKIIKEESLEDGSFATFCTEFAKQLVHHNRLEELVYFKGILGSNYLKIYQAIRGIFDEYLLKLDCVKNQTESLGDYLLHSIKNSYNIGEEGVKTVLYYGHYQIIDELHWDIFEHSPKEFQYSPAIDVAHLKFHLELEKAYQNYLNSHNWDTKPLQTAVKKYPITINRRELQAIEKALTQNQAITFLEKMRKKKSFDILRSSLLDLQPYFWKYMHQKGISIPVASLLYVGFMHYFKQKRTAFSLDETFYKFALQTGTTLLMGNYECDTALMIWGGMYVSYFFLQNRLLTAETYKQNKAILEDAKVQLKKRYAGRLWQFSFVFNWQPIDETHTQIVAQDKLDFETSYAKPDVVEIPEDELKERQELREFLSQHLFPEKSEEAQEIVETIVRETPKINRNDKVSVRYKDGTVKNSVKYKKVESDLKKGLCELI